MDSLRIGGALVVFTRRSVIQMARSDGLFRVGLCGVRIAGMKIRRALGFAISVGRHSVKPALNVLPKMLAMPNSVHSAERRWSLSWSVTPNLNLGSVAWRENVAI